MNKDNPHTASFVFDERTIHSINPLGMRVLVKIMDNQNQSKGGLYIPENAKENMSESVIAQIIAVASATDDETEEETNVSGLPKDAIVLIEKDIGIRVPWDDKLRIVETIDVLAIVEQIEIT